MRRLSSLLLICLLLAACSGAAEPAATAAPTPTTAEAAVAPTPEPTVAPTPAPPATTATDATGAAAGEPGNLPAACVAGEGWAVFTAPDTTYCFAYPERFTVEQLESGILQVAGPPLDESPEPLFAALGVEQAPAPAATLAESADALLAEFADFTAWEIERTDITLGSVPALRVEPIPGRGSARWVLAQQGDTLYRLMFWPVDMEPATAELAELYDTVLTSWRFLGSDASAAAPSAPAGAGTNTGTITGAVIWGDDPVPGATVELRQPDWRDNPQPALATTTADPAGDYLLANVPPGDYEVVPLWPEGTTGGAPLAPGAPVTVQAGQAQHDVDVFLAMQMTLLEPEAGATVGTEPTLAWEPVSGATLYRVIVNDPETLEGFFGEDVTETSVTVAPPLAPGTYHWAVNALTPSMGLLAVGDGEFTVEE
jgi:hypothetical protein